MLLKNADGDRESMILVSKYYPGFTDLKSSIVQYYRTRQFNLDIIKYLLREAN
jgi:hypothetical protein